ERQELDPRGRHLGFLELNGQDLGLQLIAAGELGVYTEYPFSRETQYLAVEQQARAEQRGLWAASAVHGRLLALRRTWAAVRGRGGAPPADQLLVAERP